MIQHFFLPIFISIIEIPLITTFDDTNISWSWKNMTSWFIINDSITAIDHFFLDHIFSINYFRSFEIAKQHNSFMKTFLVCLVFCFCQELFIVLTLDFHLLAKSDCCQVSMRSFNQRNWISRNHFFRNFEFLSQGFFLPQISCSHPIIWRIARNTCNNSCSFFHWDSHHGKSVNFLVNSKRSCQREPNQFFSFEGINNIDFFILFCQFLECHVHCWSFTAYKDFFVLHFNRYIVSSRQNKATCLTIHSFRSECCSNQENFSSAQRFFKSCVKFTNSDLDKSILIRNNSLSFSSIMISTHLIVFRWPNGRSFSKLDKSSFLKESKLPSNKGVIVRVDISGNKRTAVIDMHSEVNGSFFSKRWKIFCPVDWICELRNKFLGKSHLSHDVILIS